VSESAKPRYLAVIREAECIGCTKCIQVCPVDAILGSNKQTHTVIAEECISCKLCLPPCPVDCIDWVLEPRPLVESAEQRRERTTYVKRRVTARQKRLVGEQSVQSDQSAIHATLARIRGKKF